MFKGENSALGGIPTGQPDGSPIRGIFLSSAVQMIDFMMSTMECWDMLAVSFYEWLVHFRVVMTDSLWDAFCC